VAIHDVGDDNIGGGDNPITLSEGGGARAAVASVGIDNHVQMLIAKSTDGGATFGAPVKVGDFYELPDCPAYQGGQNPFRDCVPEKGSSMHSVFRASNYAAGSVHPHNPSQVVDSLARISTRTRTKRTAACRKGCRCFRSRSITE